MVEAIQELRMNEIARMQVEITPELRWWGSRLIDNPEQGWNDGSLVAVPFEGEGYRLIGPLRRGEEPSLLNPQAFQLLKDISGEWLRLTNKMGLPTKDTFLSVTSLYRTPELQEKFVLQGMNAAKVSPHQAGAAIDFDPYAYFQGTERGAINSKKDGFDRKYVDVLYYILSKLWSRNDIHLIVEKNWEAHEGKPFKRISCYHVCVSPEYKSQ